MDAIDERLASLLATRDMADDQQGFFLEVAELVARGAAEYMGRQEDEIGILIAGGGELYLRFAAPRRFCELGTIPMTKRDSIAVAVFTKKAGEANNNVPLVRHVAFYESVRLTESPMPIMKMVTVPIVHEGKILGVGQVSKKGENLAQAGKDFTLGDISQASDYFASKASFLAAARPDRF